MLSPSITLTPGKRVLFLTKDPELIRRQLAGELNLTLDDVSVEELLDDINTDVMTPAWTCFDYEPEQIARNAYAGLVVGGERLFGEGALRDGNFEVIVSGYRKGTGSSRETDALQAAPNDYLVVAPPAGPKGRSYMPVLAGLAIARGAPDRAGAVALIEHLTKPEIQVATALEVGFFPVVDVKLPDNMAPAIKLLAEGIAKTQGARDAVVALLPVGLADKGGEFNKVYFDTFQRIVLRNEPVRATLDAQAEVMRAIMAATKAPCWAPDKPSAGACPVN